MGTTLSIRRLLVTCLVLVAAVQTGMARSAPYGAVVKEYFIQKFRFAPSFAIGLDYSTDFAGPGLNPNGAAFNWQTRVGTILDADVDEGLYFRPNQRGSSFSLGGHYSLAQIIELETPLSGPGALNNELGTSFFTAAVYEHTPYMHDGYTAGFAFSNLLHQPTNPDQRAFGVGITRLAGQHYVMSKDFVTGQVIEMQPVAFDHPYIELRMGRAGTDSVSFSAAFLDASLIPVGQPIQLGLTLAFSDVVLRPAIFAAAPIPGPRIGVTLLAGLAVMLFAARRRTRPMQCVVVRGIVCESARGLQCTPIHAGNRRP